MKLKRPRAKPLEKQCVDCNGTGRMAVAERPTRPGSRIYPAPCKQCRGKGRIQIISN
jgi:DnaJ-class molecular chaperone